MRFTMARNGKERKMSEHMLGNGFQEEKRKKKRSMEKMRKTLLTGDAADHQVALATMVQAVIEALLKTRKIKRIKRRRRKVAKNPRSGTRHRIVPLLLGMFCLLVLAFVAD